MMQAEVYGISQKLRIQNTVVTISNEHGLRQWPEKNEDYGNKERI